MRLLETGRMAGLWAVHMELNKSGQKNVVIQNMLEVRNSRVSRYITTFVFA